MDIRVWAPHAATVAVRVDGSDTPLQPDVDGWWDGLDLPAGTDYAFVLDGGPPRPDPASRWQPHGVHEASRVYDQHSYRWQDGDWRGRDLTGAIVYELHVGTFTPGATLDSAIERLDHLVALGVTHVELLPVSAVNGVWNWGYDGVGWYAVHEPYGGPDALKRFVDAAHAHGLAVVLDVVYNHVGASGNYLPEFGPYLKAGRNTWGDFVNFAEPAVRRFVLDNAQMWLRDFHVDGLRLDAVHAIVDEAPTHILAELAAEVDALAERLGRPLSLIAESDLNDPVMITPRPAGYGLTAQWDDDVHHALHALLTGERQGYYCDFGSLRVLAKVLARAFLHDGTHSSFRGREHGRRVDVARTEAWRFVVCLQNHDQVGNRAAGERLTELTSPSLLRVGAVLLLTAPFTPMLWMGEEWGATTRWPFFTSHPQPDLARAVGPGRLAEFDGYGWDESQMIDPQEPAAYRKAILDWSEPTREPHTAVLALYRALIRLRRAEPDLTDPDLRHVEVGYDEAARWVVVHRGSLHVAANLAEAAQVVPVPAGRVLLATASATLEENGVRLDGESAAIIRLAPASPR
ncbi:MAG: maltooligosyltrehalose trehalohydrolase [Pseudonocardiales bacterium]|jgi:maltooligosyltrehalose trehalohydrolase|nr:maltooligosyltrehalose trehalohydrolase [Pseudonocardiales bacterium]